MWSQQKGISTTNCIIKCAFRQCITLHKPSSMNFLHTDIAILTTIRPSLPYSLYLSYTHLVGYINIFQHYTPYFMMEGRFMNHRRLKRIQILALCLPLLILFCISCGTPQTTVISQQQASTPISPVAHQHVAYLKGKTTSLSWIMGHDCQNGMQAYQLSAKTNPDTALVGTGWIDPTNGHLLDGSNTCVAGSNSMDNVVQLIHSKGGAAYLTITIDTGDPNAWTPQQASAYIEQATTHQSYIDSIVHEVMRVGYD